MLATVLACDLAHSMETPMAMASTPVTAPRSERATETLMAMPSELLSVSESAARSALHLALRWGPMWDLMSASLWGLMWDMALGHVWAPL